MFRVMKNDQVYPNKKSQHRALEKAWGLKAFVRLKAVNSLLRGHKFGFSGHWCKRSNRARALRCMDSTMFAVKLHTQYLEGNFGTGVRKFRS